MKSESVVFLLIKSLNLEHEGGNIQVYEVVK